MAEANTPKGLPLIPKFYGPGGSTGLTAKAALGAVSVDLLTDPAYTPPKPVKAKAPKPTVLVPLPQHAVIPTDAVAVLLPAILYHKIMKPAKGEGGWQTLIKDMQTSMLAETSDTPTLMVGGTLLADMLHKAVHYGEGGYQGIIRHVLALYLATVKGAN